MSITEQLKKIESMYSNNMRDMGTTSKAVGWNSEDCQSLRFTKLSSIIDDNGPYSVNDYGCGYGAHLRFLTETLGHDVTAYNGYDISKDMLSSARDNLSAFTGSLNLQQAENITTEADYSFVSGTFNVRFEAPREEWEDFMRAKLDEINRHSRKGFSFNVLTSYADWEETHLYYGDPSYWFDYCKKNFSRAVSLLHDYPLWEWTMIVRKS
ncbi:MAG: class I SAM-dependent methyltransferase [Alphaproteobacteria bacterium]